VFEELIKLRNQEMTVSWLGWGW